MVGSAGNKPMPWHGLSRIARSMSSYASWHVFPDKVQPEKKVHRVLNPGGQFLFKAAKG
jgi:hypothetical protein